MPLTADQWSLYVRSVLRKRGMSVTAFARRSGKLAPSTVSRQLKTGHISLDDFMEVLAELDLSCTIENRELNFEDKLYG